MGELPRASVDYHKPYFTVKVYHVTKPSWNRVKSQMLAVLGQALLVLVFIDWAKLI